MYANAGHWPAYLIGPHTDSAVQALPRTGLPLGIVNYATWGRAVAQLAPGDVLVLYTDGVTEARNEQRAFFGEDRLLESVRVNLGQSARDIQHAILRDVDEFVGDAPQFDDIALAVVVRDSTAE